MKIPLAFYRHTDVVEVARMLLGKVLFTQIDGILAAGIIVETEAYKGPEDLGSHAYNNRRTPRTEMMYSAGGVSYVYVCYGIHDMFNIVTGKENESHAVLIRALQPCEGLMPMKQRRGIHDQKRLCKGPGALAKAMGITKRQNGVPLDGNEIWLEEKGIKLSEGQICAVPRIGLNIAEPYKSIPWRFYIQDNPFISRK